MTGPAWWDEMAAGLEAGGLSRHSAAWYAGMRDAYLIRFPHADQRSKDNMRLLAEWAAAKEPGQGALFEAVA